ncbi:MAG: S-layer homology domain-containing protein, partial [Syntrophomonadaceae bacterium]|nr:S-layer homology domain-containing protein [Syntrophomonadaceae bacterium]
MIKRKITSQNMFIAIIAALLIIFALARPALADASSQPSDINGHWAETIINEMLNTGILSGYADGSFKPDAAIKRAEYAAIIVKSFGLSGSSEKVFNDTLGHWAQDPIAIAYQHGIIQGYSDAEFGPDDPISREDAALMIVKAAGLTGAASLDFSDQEKISALAKSSVDAAVASGVFSGYPDGSFKPQGKMSRAEAAAVLSKYLGSNTGKTDPGISKEFNKAGVYGPAEGIEVIANNVVVKADGVILQNLHIQKDLIIAEEVGEGTVTLNNIAVDGNTLVRGGGKNSIHVNGGSYNKIVIQQTTSSGTVRIVASNAAGLEVVIAENAAGESIILEGSFAHVLIEAANVDVKIQGETIITNMAVAAGAESGRINLDANSKIENMVLQAATEIKGTGKIVKAEVKANNVIFEKAPEQQIVDTSLTIPPTTTTTSNSGGGGDSDSHTKYYTLTIIMDGQGTVTPGEAIYRTVQGSKIELSAVPAEGWKFIGWFIYEDEYYTTTSNNPEYEINGIDSNYTLRALFTIEYKGSGSIKDENNEPMEDVTVTLSGEYMETTTTTTNENGWWEAMGLLGDVVITPSLDGHSFEPASTTISQDNPQTVFQGGLTVFYTLTVNQQGQGTVTPEGTFELEKGTRVPLTAIPATGWIFTGWLIS